MFKKENQIWLYLIGVLIMFGLLGLSTQNILFPFFTGEEPVNISPVYERAPDRFIDTTLDYRASIITNFGNITIDLFENSAPNNVNNFAFLSNEDFYVGTKFHRLNPGLLVQGGDRNTLNNNQVDDGLGGPGYVVRDEINLNSLNLSEDRIDELERMGIRSNNDVQSNNLVKYTIAMASSGFNTNGSQFFIVLANSSDPRVQLMNGQFTVIGQVTDGFATLNAINQVPVNNPQNNAPRPTQDIVVEDIQIYTI